MKKLLLVLTVSVTLFSCNKEVITPKQPTQQTVTASAFGDWHLFHTVNSGTHTDWDITENTYNFSQNLITCYTGGNVLTEDIVWLNSLTYVMANTVTVDITTLNSDTMIVEHTYSQYHTIESYVR